MTDDYYDDIDRQMRIFVFIAIVVVFSVIALVFYVGRNENINLNKMKKACEAQNGALLDHTTRVGKVDRHKYVCVDRNIIIEYKTK